MRAPARSTLGALALGVVAALAVGEGLVRLAAWWSPTIRYLAVPRAERDPREFSSLEAYLASQPTQVVPHRNWFNYWNNALGLNDVEFAVPKPSGRFRILAVGDSFTFGLVPYPQTVMTILEARLRAVCPGMDLDVLNFGIGGTGVQDYRTLVRLGLTTYDPDLVLINFYAGNDAPSVYRYVHERSRSWPVLGASRLWLLGRNTIRLWRAVDALDTGRAPSAGVAARGLSPRGGTPVDPARHVSERDPALTGPIFTEAAFAEIQAEEMRRFYRPEDPAAVDGAWRPILADLEAIRLEVLRQGRRLTLALYPSALQVYPGQGVALVEALRRRPRYAALSSDAFDPSLPNRQLVAYCRRATLPCVDLTPVFVEASRSSAEALYKQRDAHWTIRGNRVAADAQAEFLASLVCPGSPGPRAATR
ncbi:MAG TPA: SGNH/GDSL hydrolase family protein [Methylomirabilota bacterium]|nr:SGNH/GDSL hydrolase family protein [Methylomirabilota bacterium]